MSTATATKLAGGGEVEERIWKACAGNLVRIPAVNTTAYYFPQGHLEQSPANFPASSFSPQVKFQPCILCRVLQVRFLADHATDEVFAEIQLQKISCFSSQLLREQVRVSRNEQNDVVSFAKVLTPSDANNGGGFSVPRFCAVSIFPPLDFTADPPVQNIRVKDVHGENWEFRHIYRGTPRRHLLTTGWSKFVNSKKLVAGDSVVFMRNKLTGELFVGVRRAVKSLVSASGMVSAWGPPQGYCRNGGGGGSGGKGNVEVEKVVEAVAKAASGAVFEVVYYPRPGVAEFVVAAEEVEEALKVCWSGGMRIKMATETEDSSRLQWFQGTVALVPAPENGVFRGSIWRMLEVKWDDHEILKNMNKVSPWQVKLIPPTPSIHTAFPPTKKVKYSPDSGLFTDGEEEFPLPTVGFSSMMGHLSSCYLNYNSFPASMQGARQNHSFVSSLPNIVTDGTHQIYPEYHVDSVSQKAEIVYTDLNSQNSVQLFGTAGTKQQPCCLTRKAGITSFQLFGKIIQMEQPLNNTDEISCSENDDCGAEGSGITMDHPSVDPYKKLHDELQRSPVAEAYVKG
ncbi:hypothetical protein RND81_03G233200 [Saponaria officinalis]